MQITFDTNDLSEKDRQALAVYAGTVSVEAPAAKAAPAPEAAPKPAAKKTAAAKADPEPIPEPDETPSSDATMEQAVELATKMVSNGEAAKVKEALAGVGAKRVSEIEEKDVAAFIGALS